MIQDKNYVELSLGFKYKNGEGRNDVYSSARIRTRMMSKIISLLCLYKVKVGKKTWCEIAVMFLYR